MCMKGLVLPAAASFNNHCSVQELVQILGSAHPCWGCCLCCIIVFQQTILMLLIVCPNIVLFLKASDKHRGAKWTMNLCCTLRGRTYLFLKAKVQPCKPNIYRGGATEAGCQRQSFIVFLKGEKDLPHTCYNLEKFLITCENLISLH